MPAGLARSSEALGGLVVVAIERFVGFAQHEPQRLILEARGLRGVERLAAVAQRAEPCGERFVAPRAAEQIPVAQPHARVGPLRMRGDPVAQRREAALDFAEIDPLRADGREHVRIVGRGALRAIERGVGRGAIVARERAPRIGERRLGIELARERAHPVGAARVRNRREHGLCERDVAKRVAIERGRIAHVGRARRREPVVHHRAAELRQAHVAIQACEREAGPCRIGRDAQRRLVALRGRPALARRRERLRLLREQLGAHPRERRAIVGRGETALQRVDERPERIGATGFLVQRAHAAHGRHAGRARGEQRAQQRLRLAPVASREQRIGE